MAANDFTSAGLIGFTLGVGLVSKLVDLGLISPDDAASVADHALFQLEERQSAFPDYLSAFEEARRYLNALRQEFETSGQLPPAPSP